MTTSDAQVLVAPLRETVGRSLRPAHQDLVAVRTRGANPIAESDRIDVQAVALHLREGPEARAAWNDVLGHARVGPLLTPVPQDLRACVVALFPAPAGP